MDHHLWVVLSIQPAICLLRKGVGIVARLTALAADRYTKATHAQIEALVYDLYGLTEEGIALVEGRHRSTHSMD